MTIDEFEKKLAELEDLHAELKTQIAELKARNEEPPEPPHPRWKPMNDNAYYYIYSNEVHRTYWCDNYFDMGTYSVGNVFRTEEAAKFAIERLKVLAEMNEWAGAINDSWHIYYTSKEKKLCVGMWTMPHLLYGDLRFATEEDARNCVKVVGADRIKKYYFMIPEDKSND